MADTLVLEASGETRESSSLSDRTIFVVLLLLSFVSRADACNLKTLMALGLDYPGVRIEGPEAPELAPIRPFLTGVAADWYSVSVPLDSARIDPYFTAVAKELGGMAYFGGGSDLIEVGLLGSPKLAALAEVNVIRPWPLYERNDTEKLWTEHVVSVPAWKSRPAVTHININGESGNDLVDMVRNANAGKYLVDGHMLINVPFKHGHLATVNAKGEGRIYFRTTEDFHNWKSKILTLPDEARYVAPNQKATHARLNLTYALIVYARAKPLGWSYSPKSREIIQSWVVAHKDAIGATLREELLQMAPRQEVPVSTLREVLAEFDL